MLLLDMDKKVDLREYISTLQNGTHQAGLENNDFLGENESGPCRDRTDDQSDSCQHFDQAENVAEVGWTANCFSGSHNTR